MVNDLCTYIVFIFQTEKYQAGFEFEANKFDVPESMLPRNLNARLQFNLLGYKMNAFEVSILHALQTKIIFSSFHFSKLNYFAEIIN